MRRTVVLCASLVALIVPAAASAMHDTQGDGTLVVSKGSAPRGTPVVVLIIRGAAIGRIAYQGAVVVQDLTPNDGSASEVTGYSSHKDIDDVTQRWSGIDFRFRAVGGSYKITIYGTGVDLVASGYGNVILAGSPDLPTGDGKYSLNGGGFVSLPTTPTKPLTIGVTTSAIG
jgi:hypothetical protein